MNLKEALKKYSYAAIVTLLLAGSLFLDGPVFYCEGNDPPLRECSKLSASGRSCYFETGRDYCSSGKWRLMEEKPPTDVTTHIYVSANGKEWLCSIVDGRANSYSQCTSEAYTAYLGELV